MRRFLLTTTVLLAASGNAFAADSAPVFRPVATDPGMVLQKKAPASAPVAAPASPAANTAAPARPANVPPGVSIDPLTNPLPQSRSGETIDSIGGGAIPALPIEANTEGGISYISGGIGDEEKEQLKEQEEAYNARLQVTGPNGEYVGNVNFVLHDAKGKQLLAIDDAGPFVYIQLAPGTYTVDATASTIHKKATIKVPAKGAVKAQIRF